MAEGEPQTERLGSKEPSTLVRMRRVRGGHRASVTTNINQLQEVLETGGTRRLNDTIQFLEGKSKTLAKLDEDILDLVPDEDLEEEIQRADQVSREIRLAVISLQEALEDLTLGHLQSPHGHHMGYCRDLNQLVGMGQMIYPYHPLKPVLLGRTHQL